MTRVYSSILKKLFFACFLSAISFYTYPATEQVERCTAIKSNVNRLACFDELFKTPIRSQHIDNTVISNTIPSAVSDIFALAKNTNIETDNELEVVLSSLDDKAAIYIACKDNITRFQIVMDRPVTKNPLTVEIANTETQQSASKINWQNAERGYMLDAGRGLYAIQQLKAILYIDTFSVLIPQEKRSFTFKNNGLASKVAPIRKECGW